MIVELLQFPGISLFAGALLLLVFPERVRSGVFLLFPLIALFTIWTLPSDFLLTVPFGDYELNPVKADALSRLFGTIFALIAIIGGIYSYHMKGRGEQVAALLYAGSALGVTFAGDFFTLIVFWEIMAVSSTYLVWANRTDRSRAAGMRYLLVHTFGGGVLLSGILMHVHASGNILITALEPGSGAASVLILTGVIINAAVPPLHAWLPDAYPKATVTGAVFMSAFTTKSAVYVLMRIYPGWEILIWLGVIMALYGVVYAVLANDIREILAYHIISQVGYMVTGVGIGTEMALNGTAAHAFSHILYKSLLFMGAGAVLHATGRRKLTELGGIAGKMKWVVILYMIGAFSISGFPLFNGFISKAMVVSSAGKAHLEWVMLLLLLASVGTFLHTGLKLPYFTWFGDRREDIEVKRVPGNMITAMGIGAALCTLFGVYPDLLYRYLPHPVDYQPYTLYHLVEITQISIFTFIGFWILRKKLAGEAKLALDTDIVYRKTAPLFQYLFITLVGNVFDTIQSGVKILTEGTKNRFEYSIKKIHPGMDEGIKPQTYTPMIGGVLSFILLAFIVFTLYVMTTI